MLSFAPLTKNHLCKEEVLSECFIRQSLIWGEKKTLCGEYWEMFLTGTHWPVLFFFLRLQDPAERHLWQLYQWRSSGCHGALRSREVNAYEHPGRIQVNITKPCHSHRHTHKPIHDMLYVLYVYTCKHVLFVVL